MKIPFVDLTAQYLSIKDEIDTAIQNVINDCAFIGTINNKYIKKFEEEFAGFLGTNHCIACANGTDSLEIIIKALGIGPGDEVIVPSLSWIATSEAVSNIGAKPVFVDIEPNFFCIDESKIEEKVNARTKAIIPVHLYGHPANMPALIDIAQKYNLFVIEDCAQAHGAEINGQKVGTFGIAAGFSFFPGKNLGAFGDAGGIVTNNEELAKQCRMISQHGQLEKKHFHYIEGRNSRMDGINAAVLSVKLKYLDEWNEKRKKAVKIYFENIDHSKVHCPKIKENYNHVFHLFVIRSDERDTILKKLEEQKISAAVQYPTPLPFLLAYNKLSIFFMNQFPVASQITKQILSLPIYPEISKEQIVYISNIVNSYSIL